MAIKILYEWHKKKKFEKSSEKCCYNNNVVVQHSFSEYQENFIFNFYPLCVKKCVTESSSIIPLNLLKKIRRPNYFYVS